MPSAEMTLNGLTEISNNYNIYAVIWHIVNYVFIIFIFIGFRLTRKITSLLLVLQLISVKLFAIIKKIFLHQMKKLTL